MAIKFPIHDAEDYKGKVKITAVQQNYQTLGETFIPKRAETTGSVDAAASFGQNAAFVGQQLANIKGNPVQLTPIDSVVLYLPTQIRFADAAEYTNVDLGILGAGAAGLINSGQSLGAMAGQAMSGMANVMENLGDAITNGVQTVPAQVAALRTVGRLSSQFQGAIETTTGVTLNPNRRSTFKGIGLRKFRFSFSLVPTSAKEAERIKQLTSFLRVHMYPETAGEIGSNTSFSAAYRFPSKFQIDMRYGAKAVGPKILPCFLESMDVTFNPNSMAWHSDGEPQETVVSLSFIEERALNRQDVIDDIERRNIQGVKTGVGVGR